MHQIIVFPLLLPLLAFIVLLFFRRSAVLNQTIAIAGSGLLLGISLLLFYQVQHHGVVVLQAAGWPAPFGITLVADLFSAIMVVLAALIALVISIYSVNGLPDEYQQTSYYPVFAVLFLGVNGTFLTGDLFNLYVWFEVMIISSFVLLTLGGTRNQMYGGLKYMSMNLLASMFFLSALGILYGTLGTLNIADLSQKVGSSGNNPLLRLSAMMFFLAFGIKAALFPFFFWLPASYYTPPVTITALFSGLMTKAGVYAMIRVFTMIYMPDKDFWQPVFLIIGGLTMVVGVLTAASQYDLRRILSFHIISQIGYMIMGLGLYTTMGIGGAIFFLAHNIFSKTGAFLVSGIVERLRGTFDLKSLGDIYKDYPLVSLLMFIPIMSLAGLPPLSGFAGKLLLIFAGFNAQQWAITATAIVVSFFTLFSMVKIWIEGFWKKLPENHSLPGISAPPAGMIFSVGIFAILIILMGLIAQPVIEVSIRAAGQLIEPAEYIQQVLNNRSS